MTLSAIYISLYLSTVIVCFIKRDWAIKHKKILIHSHFILFLLILLDIFVINIRGVWLERLLVVAFLLTASATFALYRKTLPLWGKIYFGFFLFYPAIAGTTFLMDKLMFAIVASPLLVSLEIPETRYNNKEFEIREKVGVIAPMRLELIKRGFVTENVLGTCSDENVVYLDIDSINITSQAHDTTKVIVTSKDGMFLATFAK